MDYKTTYHKHHILTVGAAMSLFLIRGFTESSPVILLGGDGKSAIL